MVHRPDLVKAERDFMNADSAPLDQRIAQLFRVVGLDFGVIDFALSDKGEIIVFELNSTFQISGSIPPKYRDAGVISKPTTARLWRPCLA